MLFYLTLTLHVIVCVFLVIVVLLQQGKSADLAGAFGGQGSQTAFGPRGAANILTRLTTWCAIIFMLIANLIARQAIEIELPKASQSDMLAQLALLNILRVLREPQPVRDDAAAQLWKLRQRLRERKAGH